jgi:hypothetical protein
MQEQGVCAFGGRCAGGVMEIQGPISIGVVEKDDGVSRELHIGFKPGFRELTLEAQGQSFQGYVDELGKALSNPATADNDRAGINLIHQICSELLPHIQTGELALNETLVVEIGGGPAISLTDLAGHS